MIFDMIGLLGASNGMLRDASPQSELAWRLASCALRGNYCHEPESMKPRCDFMSDDCNAAESLYELLRLQTGDEELFRRAVAQAGEILRLASERRYEELGLVLIW